MPVKNVMTTAMMVPRTMTANDHRLSDIRFLAERTEEVRTDVETKGIDEQSQAEVLEAEQHVMVDGDAETAKHDSKEEHESHAEGDAEEAYLAQGEACCTDHRDDDDGLDGRRNAEK